MFNTLFRKLVAVLLLFGLLMSLIFMMIMRYSHNVYHDEVQQKFHAGLAQRFAVLAGWTPSGWPDSSAAAFSRMVALNAQFHVYVLDHEGRVTAHFPEDVPLLAKRVALPPIQRFLEPEPPFPILGEDPAQSSAKPIFSAAKLASQDGQVQYLYVTIRSEEHDGQVQGVRFSYVTREGAWLVGASLLLALSGGLLSLHFVVHPIKRLESMMEDFRTHHFRGELNIDRLPPASGDEIDALTTTFYRMAQQMQRQMLEIEQADAGRREFIANVSHDLRTPLASVLGYLETLALKHETLSAEERDQYIQIALNQCRSLSQLISALFYLSRLDSGQIPMQPECFRIEELVQDMVQKFALRAKESGIRLEANAVGKMPFVCADLALIDRALSNLIDNALRHTPPGGAVQIELKHSGAKVWVAVSDSGPGISDEDLPHIFKQFFRASAGSESETAANAGLGLSIVHRIADMHGECVEASNSKGGGACFRLSLRAVAGARSPCLA